MNIIESIYKHLFKTLGPQRWWPAEEPFEVMVGAILTQNTSWQNVTRAVQNLKKNNLLNPLGLKKISKDRLAQFIRSCGYFNIKAERLKEFVNFLFKNYQADLKKMGSIDMLTLRQQLLNVKGIGPETADSILLYALDKPIFVVDAYTKRILLRHKLINPSWGYEEIQNFFMQNLKKEVKLFNEYHALLVRIGKDFCFKKNPLCNLCPLERYLPKRIRRYYVKE